MTSTEQITTTTISTAENYDETFAFARRIVDVTVRADGWPEGERDKAIDDMLNNIWSDGITAGAWAVAANYRLCRRD